MRASRGSACIHTHVVLPTGVRSIRTIQPNRGQRGQSPSTSIHGQGQAGILRFALSNGSGQAANSFTTFEYIALTALLSRVARNSVSGVESLPAPKTWPRALLVPYLERQCTDAVGRKDYGRTIHCSQRIDSHEPSAPMTPSRYHSLAARLPASRWQADHLLFRPAMLVARKRRKSRSALNRFHPGPQPGQARSLRPGTGHRFAPARLGRPAGSAAFINGGVIRTRGA